MKLASKAEDTRLNHVEINLKLQVLIKSGYYIVPSPSTALPVMSVTFSGTIAPGLKQSFRVFATRGKMSSKFLESLKTNTY